MKIPNIPDYLYLVLYFESNHINSKAFVDINAAKSFIGLKKKKTDFKLISTIEYNYYQEVLKDEI